MKSKNVGLLLMIAVLCIVQSDAHAQDTITCFSHSESEKKIEHVSKNSKPVLSGYWIENPNIVLCKESGVTEQRLAKSLSYWKKLGYSFGDITISKNQDECFNGGPNGTISIVLTTQEIGFNDIAVTRTFKNTRTKEIQKAIVFMNSSAAIKTLVLEHEIGHALGWNHYQSRYHIMNKHYENIGHNSSGLHYSKYIAKSSILKYIK